MENLHERDISYDFRQSDFRADESRIFPERNEESSKSGNEPGINCPQGYGYNNMLLPPPDCYE